MTLLSAFEDFVNRTLAAIPGLLAQVRYCSQLRSPEGKYEHWGMARVHGEAQSQRAIAEAHSALFLQILRTPLARLASEADSGEEFECSQREMCVPPDLAGGSLLHFSSVLDALSALAQARKRASREAA